MLFKVENIVVYYGKIKAIDGVSLNLDDGQIVTLIGPNGAGKTTTLKAISGLKGITSGNIWFDGIKTDILPPQKIVALGIALVPERRHVFPYMSVKENLLMGAYLRRDKGGIDEDLERVHNHFPVLGERSSQLGGKLSGGEQQMVALARALMARPRLLLLDEPSLGLSPIMVREIGKAIININQMRRVGIVLVEQNSRMALKIAEKGYVLELGKVILQDSTENLMKNEQVRKAYLGE
jgi:branched-chain amino acid transport system ATP-binding protein